MGNYKQVTDALAAGTEPRMLCMTCPWDRNCVEPPSMTKADVDAEIAKAKAKDEEEAAKARAEGKDDAGIGWGSLMTAVVVGGRDTSASCCPVFALRFGSHSGRRVADTVRALMTDWDDDA